MAVLWVRVELRSGKHAMVLKVSRAEIRRWKHLNAMRVLSEFNGSLPDTEECLL